MPWRPPWPQITTENQERRSKQVQPKAASSSCFQGDFPKRLRKKCKEGLLVPATQQCGSLGHSLAPSVSSVSSKGLGPSRVAAEGWEAGTVAKPASDQASMESVYREAVCLELTFVCPVQGTLVWCFTKALSPQSTRNACLLAPCKNIHSLQVSWMQGGHPVKRRWGGLERSSLPLSLLRGLKFPRWDLTQEEKSSMWATIYGRIRPVIVRGSYTVLISFLFPFFFPFLSCSSVITSFLWHPQLWLRALYSRTKLATCRFVCSSCASKPGALSLTSAPLGYNSLQQERIRRPMRELSDLEDALPFYS